MAVKLLKRPRHPSVGMMYFSKRLDQVSSMFSGQEQLPGFDSFMEIARRLEHSPQYEKYLQPRVGWASEKPPARQYQCTISILYSIQVCFPILLHICAMFFHLFICLFFHLFVCLFISLFDHLFICSFVSSFVNCIQLICLDRF